VIIGLTGLIGSGKTEVARIFEGEGAHIIDADRIGREVVETDSVVFYRLIHEFGPTILHNEKELDRRKLGELAFSSIEKTDLLNSIVHPSLLTRLDALIAEARIKKVHTVVDAALLVYWGYHDKMDTTVLVSATAEIRTARLIAKGLTLAEIDRRTQSQLSEEILIRESNHILYNNGSHQDLADKAVNLYRKIT